jgi:hypothetical protein
MVVKPGFVLGDKMPTIVACFSSLLHFCSAGEFQRWAEQHKATHLLLHIYLFSPSRQSGLEQQRLLQMQGTYNWSENRFREIAMIHFKVMVCITVECIDTICIWMMSIRPCNVIPIIMPLTLNPPALKEKRLNELMELLERSIVYQDKVQKGPRRGPNATFSSISYQQDGDTETTPPKRQCRMALQSESRDLEAQRNWDSSFPSPPNQL